MTLSLQGSVYMTLSQEHAGQHLRHYMQSHQGNSLPDLHHTQPCQYLEDSTHGTFSAHTLASPVGGYSGTHTSRGSVASKPGGGGAIIGMHARVLLRPRALQLLTGRSRFNFTHGICTDHILDERRVSITFRYSPLRPVR